MKMTMKLQQIQTFMIQEDEHSQKISKNTFLLAGHNALHDKAASATGEKRGWKDRVMGGSIAPGSS
jgi:hypothetical protein